MARMMQQRRRHPFDLVLSLLFSGRATADLFYTAISPIVQDGLLHAAPSVCPVAQDGYAYNTFPWTHTPTCVNVVLTNEEEQGPGVTQTFCAYTNANYNNGRGVSFVVTPEVAASLTYETYGMAVGGAGGEIGEEMGMWEVKSTPDRGKALFSKRDIAAIFAGESLIIKTPVLFVTKELLATPSTTQMDLMLTRAVEQLPAKTKKTVRSLSKTWAGTEAFSLMKTNGFEIKWPWVDDVPQLLAVTPEVARINHACRPNAIWRFDDYTLGFDVVALKDIKPGEEITMSYGYEKRPHKRRNRSIEANLNFSCLCPLCTADDDAIMASNDRLSEIKALKSVLPTDSADSPQLLGLLPNLIKAYDEEDLHTETPMYEEILAYTWSSFGIETRAKYWAGRARQHWGVLAGAESWESKRCGDLENNVRGHATWMTWEGDPWEDVGEEEHDHGHDHGDAPHKGHAHFEEEGEDLDGYDQRPDRDQFRGHV